jgi:thiamine-phosphate pyrophosphorylase
MADYSVYLVTDSRLAHPKPLEDAVEEAIRGGVSVVQLREKEMGSLDFYNLGMRVKKVTGKYNIPLIVNDRLDIAQAIDAEGVHIGQSDLPCRVARNILGKGKIIGVSAKNLDEARKAEDDGADYLGIGAFYSTATKKDANMVSFEELEKITRAVKIPVVVIGGINQRTIPNFKGFDIDGVAVVSAIMSASNIEESSREIRTLWQKYVLAFLFPYNIQNPKN